MTLSTLIFTIMILLLSKFAEDFMKSFKKGRHFIGPLPTGSLKLSSKHSKFVRDSIFISLLEPKISIVC